MLCAWETQGLYAIGVPRADFLPDSGNLFSPYTTLSNSRRPDHLPDTHPQKGPKRPLGLHNHAHMTLSREHGSKTPGRRKSYPKDVIRRLYVEEYRTQEEVKRKLAELGFPIALDTLRSRLHDWGFLQSRSERYNGYMERGRLRPYFHEHPLKGKDAPGWIDGYWKEYKRVLTEYPQPLGECFFGVADAEYRFRIDFRTETFIDRETSSHLVVVVCPYHSTAIKNKRTELGLPRSLETGRQLLQEVNSPCVPKVSLKTCPECKDIFKPHPKTQTYCTRSCRAKALNFGHEAREKARLKGKKLYTDRILNLHNEGYSERQIVKELIDRWPHYRAKKLYPISRTSIRKVIHES